MRFQPFTISVGSNNIVAKVRVTSPYRPAPPCYNHDSPAFSDSGDDLEFEIESAVDAESGAALDESQLEVLSNDDDDFYDQVCHAVNDREIALIDDHGYSD